ncbi:peptidyl-prolyl cis-trans isomerase [Marinitoga lauensis]|uniref:peptidyl-prolyl cis-trans isomerase n=1 Tax=Marinitoga lauensis TaxID=2201189 RepID=UPI001405247E|nr:peptidyl-prolyl cis-trans isomerase [Marinitoga lauensis]
MYNSIKSQIENIFNSSKLSENDILLYLISKGFENKEQYIYSVYHEKLYQRAVSAIYQYLIDNVSVSENEIKDEYNKNKDKYYKPQSANIKLVLFSSSDDASLAYQKIIDGYYSFDDIYFNKLTTKEATIIKINLEDNTSNLIKTIKSSFPGAILKPMKYNNNYYALIKIDKKIPKQQMSVEEAKSKIIENIKDEKAKKLFDNLVASEFQKFKDNSEIIINSKFFKGDESNGN